MRWQLSGSDLRFAPISSQQTLEFEPSPTDPYHLFLLMTADCVAKCGSAFESVLKVLCQKNHIGFDPNKDVAARLLDRLLPHSTLDVATFKKPLLAVARMRNRLSSSHGG